MFKIKPLKQNVVDPKSGAPLTEAGIKVAMIDSYWHRRVSDKDVEIEEIAEEKSADQNVAPKKKESK